MKVADGLEMLDISLAISNDEMDTVICYHGGLFRGKINQRSDTALRRIAALAKGE